MRIPRVRCAALLALLALLIIAPAFGVEGPASLSTAQWRHDLQFLAAELPRAHPNPFHAVTESAWRAEVAALDARLPTLHRDQIAVQLMRLVAMIGEGHTALNPLYRPELGFHYLPIRPYWFADGFFVRSAAPEHADLVGARIVSIGGVSAEEALRRVSAVVAHDNESGARNTAPLFLVMPEVLAGLGWISDDRVVPMQFEKDGRRFEQSLTPAGVLTPHGHGPLDSAMNTAGWIDAREQAGRSAPLAQRPTSTPLYWSALLAEEKTFYIQYNGVVDAPDDPIAAFFPRAIAEAERSDANRLVIDVRNNGGGNSFLNRPIIKSLIRSRFDQRGHLFVIIGRGTFSAAQNFVNDLTNWTNALFVGEPTASNPNQYGDHVVVRLPESHYEVMVATLYHQSAGPQDHRTASQPQLPAEPTFAQYRDGIDPAVDTVVRYRSIADALAANAAANDETGLERAYETFKHDPATSWIPTESEINTLGYSLLSAKKMGLALVVFRLNVASYPHSANAFDSLGECYAQAGDRAQALDNYRRALVLDPTRDGTRRAIENLEATAGTS